VRQELRNYPYGELLTQWQLARRVGVSVETIKKIENGQLKMSKRLAYRLAIATGIDLRQLTNNSNPDKMPGLAYSGEIAWLLNIAAITRKRGLPPPEELVRALYGPRVKRQKARASGGFTRLR